MDPSEDWTDEEKAEAKNATRRSRELLEYIIKSPEFAKVITKVSVRAYIPTEDTLPEEVICECCCWIFVIGLGAN